MTVSVAVFVSGLTFVYCCVTLSVDSDNSLGEFYKVKEVKHCWLW